PAHEYIHAVDVWLDIQEVRSAWRRPALMGSTPLINITSDAIIGADQRRQVRRELAGPERAVSAGPTGDFRRGDRVHAPRMIMKRATSILNRRAQWRHTRNRDKLSVRRDRIAE